MFDAANIRPFSKMPNKIDKNIFSPRPRLHARAVVFMVLVLLDAFLYIRAFLYEDDRPAVYPYGDSLYPRVGRDGLAAVVLYQYRS